MKIYWFWIFVVALFIFLFIACAYFHEQDSKNDAYISIIGSITSIIGIIVALKQIYSVRSKTVAVEKAIEKTRKQIEFFSIYTDINKLIPLINEIQSYIKAEKYELAINIYSRLKSNLNEMLGFIVFRDDLKLFNGDLKVHVDTAGNDVKTLHMFTLNETTTMIDKYQILRNLENIKSFLEQSSGKLKSNGYEG